jgi:hypothetical protein
MKVTEPCTVTFKGLGWDAHWQFDCPVIVYCPVCAYNPFACILPHGIVSEIEEICDDLACGDEIKQQFSDGELKEFKSRDWEPCDFASKEGAHHATVKVEFFLDDEGIMSWKTLSEETIFVPVKKRKSKR